MKQLAILILLLLALPLSLPAPTVRLTPVPQMQFLDNNGDPLSGGHVHTYEAGTTTNQASYTDSTGNTANANPVVLDSAGRADIWLDVALSYRLDVHDSADVVVYSVDVVTAADVNRLEGTYLAVTFSSTPTFDSSVADIFSMTLSGNVTSSTVSNAATGDVIGFQLCQDATGGRTFTWPATFLRPPVITSVASACTNLSFFYDGTNWRPLGASSDNSIGIGTDIRLERVAANTLQFDSDDILRFGSDVQISRGAADRLDLATGDTLRLDTLVFDTANGDITLSRSAASILRLADDDILEFGSTNPATTGQARFRNNQLLGWRNAGNTANLTAGYNSSDVFLISGSATVSGSLSTGGSPLTIGAGGVAVDGAGFKHHRTTVGCITAATAGASCDTTITWTTAFADSNYDVVCQGITISSGVPVDGGVTNRIAASVDFRTVAVTAVAAQFTNILCIAVHD